MAFTGPMIGPPVVLDPPVNPGDAYQPDQTIHHSATATAAWRGDTKAMLEAVIEHGFPWSEQTTHFAAQQGHTKTMLAAVEHGCPWHPGTTSGAALRGQTETMLAAVEHGCPWDEETIASTFFDGNEDTRRAALEHGCPPDPLVPWTGPYRMDRIIRAALEHKCPWCGTPCPCPAGTTTTTTTSTTTTTTPRLPPPKFWFSVPTAPYM